MGVVISIYKSCYPKQAEVMGRLLPLCQQVRETDDAFLYMLDQRQLLSFLRVLDEFRVPFGLYSNTEPAPGYGMQSLTQPHSTQDN
jgi:hypothetical protein